MEAMAWLTLLALIVSPTLAVQVQKWVERNKSKNDSRLSIFKSLMATRSAKISHEHVRALNMIDIEFYETNNIIDAWKLYRDHLNSPAESTLEIWASRSADLLTDLLFEMGKSIGYNFNKVDLKKGFYSPRAHFELENDWNLLRKSSLDIFSGKKSINVNIMNSDDN